MAMKMRDASAVPTGVRVTSLTTHPDDRGDLTELFRMEWIDSPAPIQWANHRGCRWDAPELGFEWPCTSPILSAKDRNAGSYAELEAGLRADLALSSAPI
jgi:dTDP-4-dehydrorhamnose 3,5-epimerase-like enzyme